MCLLNLKIGDVVPIDGSYRIQGENRLVRDGIPCSVWFPIRVVPGKEKAAIALLANEGVTAFCPMEKTRRFFRGKVIRGERPHVSQIVYAKFTHQPMWHVLQARRIITGVMCRGATPIELPRDAIRILRGLSVSSERLRRAKEEMMKIQPGEKIEILDGPMAGFFAEVTECKSGRVWWKTVFENGLPVTGECSREQVERQDVA